VGSTTWWKARTVGANSDGSRDGEYSRWQRQSSSGPSRM
jgi:hypothetical protein